MYQQPLLNVRHSVHLNAQRFMHGAHASVALGGGGEHTAAGVLREAILGTHALAALDAEVPAVRAAEVGSEDEEEGVDAPGFRLDAALDHAVADAAAEVGDDAGWEVVEAVEEAGGPLGGPGGGHRGAAESGAGVHAGLLGGFLLSHAVSSACNTTSVRMGRGDIPCFGTGWGLHQVSTKQACSGADEIF